MNALTGSEQLLEKRNISLAAVLLLTSFFISVWKVGSVTLDFDAVVCFIIFALSWIISMLLTQKFTQKQNTRRITYWIAPFVKSYMVMVLALWVLQLFVAINPAYSAVLYNAATVLLAAELGFVLYWYLSKGSDLRSRLGEESLKGSVKSQQTALEIEGEKTAKPIDLTIMLNDKVFNGDKVLQEFISTNVKGRGERVGKYAIVSVNELNELLPDYSMLVSSTRLNDVRRLNKFLLTCNKKLLPGGWIAVKYRPLQEVEQKIREKFRGSVYWFVYGLHFMINRAIPKIPYLNSGYFFVTRGKRRVISKTEIWGRLSYCGFDVQKETKIDDIYWIIARKTMTPSENKAPSYFPVIKLDRVGFNGRIIKAHKVRSMYPFSEYLQKRVYDENNLASSGKINKDYRITNWGSFCRKYWLDELPQVIDWLRGDIKLVGIRALSKHYYSLYPKEYQDLFIQVKPGLLPPLFDENTADFDEIVSVENTYLKKYLKNAFRTDVEYFFKTLNQILRGTHSG